MLKNVFLKKSRFNKKTNTCKKYK